ncbi:pilus assembly protein PilO [Synechococcus elongatus IITB7]|uniref:pilus assembly protein PilO n=1 Tax=Synechococcus elongatus TaxID=32046 RepID=UPI0030CE36B7
MTVSLNKFPEDNRGVVENIAPAYPTLFGLTVTPVVGGILAAVTGLFAASWIYLNLVQPAQQQANQLAQEVDDLRNRAEQQAASLRQIGLQQQQLANARAQQRVVQSFFASPATLDTLLLEINGQVRRVAGLQLQSYLPKESSIVTDGSFGEGVNNKLKQTPVFVEVSGGFNQTVALLRGLEQLQPLLLVQDVVVTAEPVPIVVTPKGRILPRPAPKLTTQFNVVALSPLTPEEQKKAEEAAAAAAGNQPNQGGGNQPNQESGNAGNNASQ